MRTAPTTHRTVLFHRPVHLLGFWCSEEEPHWPAPQDFVDPSWDPTERDLVATYLERGTENSRQHGMSWCRFTCGSREMGNRELTDGHYVWPEGLSHYVRHHAVRLPGPFVDHVRRRPFVRYWKQRALYAAVERLAGVGTYRSDAWWRRFRTGTQVGAGSVS